MPGRRKVLTAQVSVADDTGRDAPVTLDRPSLDQLIDLFERLGTAAGGDLFINGTPGDRQLMVGGGPECYLVSCAGDGYGAYNLVDPTAAGREGWVTLIAGRVLTPVPEAEVVGHELARQAVEYFYTHGEVAPRLRWG